MAVSEPTSATNPRHSGEPTSAVRLVASHESETAALPEDRKIGVGGAMLLIFNKVIGTGSEPSW